MCYSPTPASPDLTQLPCSCQFPDEFILLLILGAEWEEFIHREMVKYRNVANLSGYYFQNSQELLPHLLSSSSFESKAASIPVTIAKFLAQYELQGNQHSLK